MKWLGFTLPLLLLAGGARADDSPPVLTLLTDPGQLASWLRDRDPQIYAATQKIVQADELAAQARVFPNPQAQAGIAGIVLGSPNRTVNMGVVTTGPTGITDTSNISLGVSELFEIGKRAPRHNAANFRIHEATESAVGTLGGQLNNATTTLGKLAYVVAKRGLADQNRSAAQQLQDKELHRKEKNDLAGNDFSRIELDTQALELELERADADLAVALATCSATLFAPCAATGLDAAALDAAAPLPAALPETQQAIAQRPEHLAQHLEVSALGEDANLATNRKIPDPTLALTYTYDNYQYSGSAPQTLAFSVGIPLPFFDTGTHDAAAARANARSLEAQDQATVRSERGQVDAYLAQLSSLKKTLARLENDSVPKSKTIVENTRKAFDGGQSGLADLLLAERQYRDLQAQALDTRFDLFNVRVSLRQVLGLDDQAARTAGLGGRK